MSGGKQSSNTTIPWAWSPLLQSYLTKSSKKSHPSVLSQHINISRPSLQMSGGWKASTAMSFLPSLHPSTLLCWYWCIKGPWQWLRRERTMDRKEMEGVRMKGEERNRGWLTKLWIPCSHFKQPSKSWTTHQPVIQGYENQPDTGPMNELEFGSANIAEWDGTFRWWWSWLEFM